LGSSGIHHLELIALALLMATAILTTVARRFETPYPIVLVIGGLLLSLFPSLPSVSLSPQLVFLVFLPPLVFSGAFNTSWRDFRGNLVSISMLAFGLVGFTVAGVAILSDWLLPGFDWRLGCALGAVVSTTDTIAAISIAKRVGLPRRISDLIEGESLINDASGLLALQFAVAAVVSGERPTFTQGMAQLIGLVAGGIVVGLVSGKIIHLLQSKIEDPPVEITVTLTAPYLAYLSAETFHCSGVLATVVCGLYLGRKRSEILSTSARLDTSAVWNTLDFVLNGVLFILIGLQLPYILAGIRGMSRMEMFEDAALFSLMVIGLRLIWMYPGAWTAYFIRTRLLGRKENPPRSKEVFLLGWTGMRGVLALAAAISLPEYLNNGQPFPQRNLILFLTFSIILTTLVLQGLTLPAIIRRLRIGGAGGGETEMSRARRAMLQAALSFLRNMAESDRPDDDWIVEDLIHHYRQRLNLVEEIVGESESSNASDYRQYRSLARELRALERATHTHMCNKNQINDETLRELERELDLEDARAASLTH
jgi:CPA1 family monovalent cation:H+ antiporter